MKHLLQGFFCLFLCFLTGPLFADSVFSFRPDDHAPIGVMGDHGHKRGEWMVSSRLMLRSMDRYSSRRANMWMFTPGAMYGVTDQFTVMAMIPYRYHHMGRGDKGRQDGERRHGRKNRGDGKNHKTTDHDKKPDGDKISRHGVGDISLTGFYSFFEEESYKALLTLGLLASPKELKVWDAYGVQGAFVFVNYWSVFSVGSQIGLKSLFHTTSGARNHDGFVNLWSALILNDNVSVSARVKYEHSLPSFKRFGNHGLVGAFVYMGGNFIGTDFAKGHRVALEVGTPVDKPSLIAILGWQKTF